MFGPLHFRQVLAPSSLVLAALVLLSGPTVRAQIIDSTRTTVRVDAGELESVAIALPGFGPDRSLRFVASGNDRPMRLDEDLRITSNGGAEYRFIADEPAGAGRASILMLDSAGVLAAQFTMEVRFPRSWMLPVEDYRTGDTRGTSDEGTSDATRVSAIVRCEYRRADGEAPQAGVPNWIARGAMPPFALAAQPDLIVSGGELVVDQSLLAGSRDTPAGTPEWVGMKVTGATIELPSAFRDAVSDAPIRIDAGEIVLDDGGPTMRAGLAAPAEIRFDDWRATLDSAGLALDAGAVIESRVAGSVALPDLDRRLAFEGTIASQAYTLSLGAAEQVRLERWKSTLSLSGGSLEISPRDGAARALLSGSLSLDSTIEATHRIDVRGVHFEGLGLRSGTREVTLPLWSHASPQHGLGAYPFSITDIGYAQRGDGRRVLRFSFGLNLAEASSAILGIGQLDVLEEIIGPQLDIDTTTFVYEGGKIARLRLDVVEITDAMNVGGELTYFEGHPIYGDGWFGKLDAVVLHAGAEVVGQFGTMNPGTSDQYRYWYFDTRIQWPGGVPLGTTGAAWYGIRGGLAYHMRALHDGDTTLELDDVTAGIGRSVSGMRFIPDSSTLGRLSIGGIIGSYPDPFMLKCDVALYGELTTSNALAEIGIDGVIKVAEKKVLGIPTGLYAFTADFDAWLELDPTLEFGCAVAVTWSKIPFKITGTARLLIGADDWYLMVGDPVNRVKLTFLYLIPAADGYLMMGSQLPPDHLEGSLATKFPAEAQLFAAGGAGFAMGARMWGWKKSGSWHGLGYSFELAAGFGLSVRHYDGACDAGGRPAELGLNGWYAMGRIYGILEIGVDLWGWNPTIGASAIALGGGPNPFWLKGSVRVRWLGSFRFSLGSPPTTCDRSLALPSDFIRSIVPGPGDTVNVFTRTVATFQAGIGEEFELELQTFDPMNPDRPPEHFRLRPVLKELSLRRAADGELVGADIATNLEARSATLTPIDALEGRTLYRARVVVAADSYDSLTRSWKRWRDGAAEITRDTTVSFRTFERPREIPGWNIAFATPLERTRDFYPRDGTGPGRLHLRTGAAYLLDPPARIAVRFTARNGGTDGASVESDALVHGKAIDFAIPELAPGEFYRGEIVRKGTPGAGGLATPDSTVLSWHFRTSAYASLADKIADMPIASIRSVRDTFWLDALTCSGDVDAYWGRRMPAPIYPELTYGLDRRGEGFDELELRGMEYDVGHGPTRVPPMLHVRSLSHSPWHVGFYQDTILRLVDLSLAAALRSTQCGADITEASGAFAHLRSPMSDADTILAMPLLSDAEIASGLLAPEGADRGGLRVDYRDELVAWRFWTHAQLVDSCQRASCGVSDPALHDALNLGWRPLPAGRYDLSAWYDGRWWRPRVVGGDFIGTEPVVVPGILTFDHLR